jgi:glycosyltransferase involved in cell wall biosynthesis
VDELKTSKFYYFAPHPVQYHYGIYKELAKFKNLDFKVIYEDNIGLKPTYVKEFKKEIKWDIGLLDGYPYEFMKNYSLNPHGGFFARVNFDIFKFFFIDKPDVILFKGYVNFSDWLIMILAILTRTKIIFRGEATLRGIENDPAFKHIFKFIFLNIWLKACDIVMFSCSGNKDYWKFYGVDESKMLPIPCAVDNEFFQNERKKYFDKKGEIKKNLGICDDNLVLLFSARFTSRKRPLDLLKAVSNIDHSNITVLFVGDGPERSNMEKYSKRHHINAIFTGFVNQTEISKYYSISDLNVVISDYDPSPKAMNEAMNFKLPIIVTDIVGTAHDLVKDGENGFIVKVGDINTISQKIENLNKNRDIAKQMSQKSLEIVNEWTFKKDAYYINKAINQLEVNK